MRTITSCVSNVGAIWGAEGADKALFWDSAIILAVFLIGAVVGILGFSKFLHWLLARWNRETLIVLAGFIIGSLVKVWPWSNAEARAQDDMHIWGAVIFALIGFCLVTGIEIAGKLIKKS
jgi:putative membrane protein